MKISKTFLDKKNEEYKKKYSKKNPNMARTQDLQTRKVTSKQRGKAAVRGAK
jgi:hypothetical protein